MKIFFGTVADKLANLKSDKVKYTKELKKLDRSIQVQTDVIIELYKLYNDGFEITFSNVQEVFKSFTNANMFAYLNEFINIYYDLLKTKPLIHKNDLYGACISNGIGLQENTKEYDFIDTLKNNNTLITPSVLENLSFDYVGSLYYDTEMAAIDSNDPNRMHEDKDALVLWMNKKYNDLQTLVKIYCFLFEFLAKYDDDFINCYNNGQGSLQEWEQKSKSLSSKIAAIMQIIDQIAEEDSLYYSDKFFESKYLIRKTSKALNTINNTLQDIIDRNNLSPDNFRNYTFTSILNYNNSSLINGGEGDENEISIDELTLPAELVSKKDDWYGGVFIKRINEIQLSSPEDLISNNTHNNGNYYSGDTIILENQNINITYNDETTDIISLSDDHVSIQILIGDESYNVHTSEMFILPEVNTNTDARIVITYQNKTTETSFTIIKRTLNNIIGEGSILNSGSITSGDELTLRITSLKAIYNSGEEENIDIENDQNLQIRDNLNNIIDKSTYNNGDITFYAADVAQTSEVQVMAKYNNKSVTLATYTTNSLEKYWYVGLVAPTTQNSAPTLVESGDNGPGWRSLGNIIPDVVYDASDANNLIGLDGTGWPYIAIPSNSNIKVDLAMQLQPLTEAFDYIGNIDIINRTYDVWRVKLDPNNQNGGITVFPLTLKKEGNHIPVGNNS